MSKISPSVAIVGAGLAGSEAALVLASRGIRVALYEMRPKKMTPAHQTDLPAELVCSNSLKSDKSTTAHGILKAELDLLHSPLLQTAFLHRVPAGSALAIDRTSFSQTILAKLQSSSEISITIKEIEKPPEEHDYCILAAGPLASEPLTNWIITTFSLKSLSFYDAISPIISTDSIDMTRAFWASRWDQESMDYLNCPFTEDEYKLFYQELLSAEKVKLHEFEQQTYFEACLPIEVVAARGYMSLPFGILRPVGIKDPRTGCRPFAICQMRKETNSGESLNMVGFQTKMTIKEQQRVLRLIPGLANAEFLRFGSIHRNTYIDSPRLLAADLSFHKQPNLFIAGQLCGNEGYTESIVTGHLAALFVWARLKGKQLTNIPKETACGSLLNHILQTSTSPFNPSNINFGLFSPLNPHPGRRLAKKEKRRRLAERALFHMEQWIKENHIN